MYKRINTYMHVNVGLTQKLPLELLWLSELMPGG